jgi:hypothetical protein
VDEPDVVDQRELVLHPLAADLAFANLQNLQLLVLLTTILKFYKKRALFQNDQIHY